VEVSNPSINPSSIVNILTLRYDPSISPNLPKKTWKDFLPAANPIDVEYIEKSILNKIKNTLDNFENKKITIALSGGVDSTLVLSLIRKINPTIDIEAISIKFANSVDETPDASKIAQKYNASHNIISLENYLSELPKAISMIKLPFWDLHWYYVVKKAKSISNILVSGDGGDELFGGYTFRYKKFLSLTSDTSTPLEKIKAYLECHERDRVPNQESIFNKKSNFSWEYIYNNLLQYFDNDLPRLEQVYLADYNGKLLYNFNPINSRIVNHFQMQMLAPILNDELLTHASHIPSFHKYDQANDVGKIPLRKILKENNADSLVTNQKLGFNVNTQNLWNFHGHDLCHEFLDKSRVVEDGWINNDWIQKYIDKPNLDIKFVNKFLGILALEIWYRLFITKEISSEQTLN
jgi:asparagine synthase (glutamine-hydrolysing)